jgi:hypothetical protein
VDETVLTPYMSLPNPIPTVALGPNWAYALSACMNQIDSHNHSSGQGQQIQPSGLNINSDLTFNSNNATALRVTRFTSQSGTIANAGSEKGQIYVVGNELYYNDYTGGNIVQITNNGSVNAGAGSISGLPSGTASASFAAAVFTWQSATSTPANMDFGSAVLRNSSNTYGLTLQPPTLSSNYSITLPTVPVTTNIMSLDSSGNMGASINVDNASLQLSANVLSVKALGIQKTMLAALGQQISSSSGAFTTSSTSGVDVTNLTVTITTTGRPVFITLTSGTLAVANLTGALAGATIAILRGASIISTHGLSISVAGGTSVSSGAPPGSVMMIDIPAAGTYTYKIQGSVASAAHTLAVQNVYLMAYEL